VLGLQSEAETEYLATHLASVRNGYVHDVAGDGSVPVLPLTCEASALARKNADSSRELHDHDRSAGGGRKQCVHATW